ncbi:hypothetical protein [Desulfosporosinus sp.]|uniref:hypothetical protein n=1 Tax=Desulfosporosinus sp. TaxID=157907 RepID=UPI0025C3F5BC|nr:hypothetical protein [Desulfosporosinus sp.]MBC2726096.1 hypothetical protein [Desulfosporosinus sp.]
MRKAEGFELTEIKAIISEGRQFYKKQELVKANQAVNKALSMLQALAKRSEYDEIIFSNSPFGIAYGSVYFGDDVSALIKELGATSFHINRRWYDIQPTKEQWEWDQLDNYIKQLDEDISGYLRMSAASHWATKVHGGFTKGSMPKKMNDYYQYIYNTVRRCKGKVKYFETDWEINLLGHWAGTKEQYIDCLKVFHKAVKDADPEAFVVMGGHAGDFNSKTGKPNNIEIINYVLKNAGDYFDYFDLHLYGQLYNIPHRIQWFKKCSKKLNLDKEIIVTEFGGPTPVTLKQYQVFLNKALRESGLKMRSQELRKQKGRLMKEAKEAFQKDPIFCAFTRNCPKEAEERRFRIQSRDMIQRHILILAEGVKKLYYWDLNSSKGRGKGQFSLIFGKLELTDSNFNKRPIFYIYQRMTSKLRDIKSIKRISHKDKNIYLYEIKKHNDKKIYVLWERRDVYYGEEQPPTLFKFNFGFNKAHITDVFGKEEVSSTINRILSLEITDTPVYIEQVNS